ncbi:MAG: hypothetical protein ACXABY_00875 [Candidatus Thorarchaeota archaeon]|jgi:hypothetical protein
MAFNGKLKRKSGHMLIFVFPSKTDQLSFLEDVESAMSARHVFSDVGTRLAAKISSMRHWEQEIAGLD